MKEVTPEKFIPSPNFFERFLLHISPERAVRRLRSRTIFNMAERYHGASRSRKSMSEWKTLTGDADTDILADLPTLRDRSRDLVRNNALACGALNTKVSSVVGTGLVLKSRIDRHILNLSEDTADEWEARTEAEWRLFSESTNCDICRTSNFTALQDLVFRSVLEAGDVFVLTPMSPIKDWPYQLQLQLVEADRVCNAENVADTKNLSGGIKKNDNGAPIEYHIAKSHPGNSIVTQNEWNIIKAFGSKTGRKNVLHIYHKRRIGQSRGVPDLAPVIEILKQLGRYTESELAATVISSFFTVFIKSEQTAGFAPMQPIADIGGSTADKDFKMGSGAMLDLAPNESTEIANPARPNTSFDPFVLALSRQIGTALELPFEILVKHFTASYSAARAALLEAWRYFMGRRKWLADSLCRPVYELWLTEQVASGRIAAPGYLQDPLIRSAYLSSEWIGPAAGQIDELKSVKAARERVNGGFSTESSETVGLTGGDWELDHVQRAKEVRKRREDGLIEEDLTKTGVTENGKDAYMVSN